MVKNSTERCVVERTSSDCLRGPRFCGRVVDVKRGRILRVGIDCIDRVGILSTGINIPSEATVVHAQTCLREVACSVSCIKWPLREKCKRNAWMKKGTNGRLDAVMSVAGVPV
jgi:hypothetical protein